MGEVLFLGGPWNWRRYPVDEPLPRRVMVAPERSMPVVDFYGPGDEVAIEPPLEPVAYSLRGLSNGQPVYVAPDYPPRVAS